MCITFFIEKENLKSFFEIKIERMCYVLHSENELNSQLLNVFQTINFKCINSFKTICLIYNKNKKLIRIVNIDIGYHSNEF